MLLINPPLELDDWEGLQPGTPEFERCLAQYAREYEAAVLSMPPTQLTKVIAWLVRDYERIMTNADTFHMIVLRELEERWWEASSKAATLTVLCALANSLHSRVVPVLPETMEMLKVCRRLIPFVLVTAIDDHFGVVPREIDTPGY